MTKTVNDGWESLNYTFGTDEELNQRLSNKVSGDNQLLENKRNQEFMRSEGSYVLFLLDWTHSIGTSSKEMPQR
jgi:hypothetical protein